MGLRRLVLPLWGSQRVSIWSSSNMQKAYKTVKLANFFRYSHASSTTCSALRSHQRIEVGQLCQLDQIQKPAQKPVKHGTWPTPSNLAKFFRCPRASSTACSTLRSNPRIEVGQLGQIQKTAQNPIKHGTPPTLPTFFRCPRASSTTCSTLRSLQRIEVGQLCQLGQI